MDDVRFDRLVVVLATQWSRRRLLARLAPALTGLLAAADRVSAGKKHKKHKEHKQHHRKHHHEPACCGASCPKKCDFGEACAVDADCFNNVCAATVLGTVCVDCRIDSDCDGLSDPRKFRCFGNTCFACAADFDCPRQGQAAARKLCVEPITGECPHQTPCVCGQCRDSDDCEADEFCDETNTCIARCASGREVGIEGGACQPCARDHECRDDEACLGDICVVVCRDGQPAGAAGIDVTCCANDECPDDPDFPDALLCCHGSCHVCCDDADCHDPQSPLCCHVTGPNFCGDFCP
jgi:hypothetical protein